MAQDHFAGRLRELREAMGWSQQELGERVGLHMQTVSRFERGTLKPTWEVVLALADVLGVNCLAFCQEPAAPAESRGPGRPPKGPPREASQPTRKRGRPPKGASPEGAKRGRPRKVGGGGP
jgi:transcriptional regulator with XRE-family HTH domain